MKKRIFAILVLSIVSVITACGKQGRPIKSVSAEKHYMKIVQYEDNGCAIVRDKRTGVEYLITDDGVSPMYNADGSLFSEGEEADGE